MVAVKGVYQASEIAMVKPAPSDSISGINIPDPPWGKWLEPLIPPVWDLFFPKPLQPDVELPSYENPYNPSNDVVKQPIPPPFKGGGGKCNYGFAPWLRANIPGYGSNVTVQGNINNGYRFKGPITEVKATGKTGDLAYVVANGVKYFVNVNGFYGWYIEYEVTWWGISYSSCDPGETDKDLPPIDPGQKKPPTIDVTDEPLPELPLPELPEIKPPTPPSLLPELPPISLPIPILIPTPTPPLPTPLAPPTVKFVPTPLPPVPLPTPPIFPFPPISPLPFPPIIFKPDKPPLLEPQPDSEPIKVTPPPDLCDLLKECTNCNSTEQDELLKWLVSVTVVPPKASMDFYSNGQRILNAGYVRIIDNSTGYPVGVDQPIRFVNQIVYTKKEEYITLAPNNGYTINVNLIS